MRGVGVLQIEPTDYCNLTCKMCKPHHQQWNTIHGVPKGFLSISVFDSLIDDFLQNHIEFDHIIFQWLGDPLVHPKIDVLLKKAQKLKSNVNYLRIDTNGIALDEHRIANILKSAIDGAPLLIVFSVDAFSTSTYIDVKGRDYRDVVYKNIRHLIRQRRKIGEKCHVNIQIQFVVQDRNYLEIPVFLEYFVDILGCQGSSQWHDEILFKPLSVDGGSIGQKSADHLYASILPLIEPYKKHKTVQIKTWDVRPWQQNQEMDSSSKNNKHQRSACPGLWMTPVIRHDGELLLCCADLQSEMSLGNLQHHSFGDLWNSRKAVQKRMEHLQGTFTGVCDDCGGINWYDLSKKQKEDTKQRAKNLGLH
jgi:radical SAM protein with 4Fe4S-binding SPASM domain